MASQSDVLSEHAKSVLYGREMSRAHTAYGRLSSLMALPSYKQAHPLALAEQGICNVGDANLAGGLRFYQQHQVEFESLHHHANEAGEYDAGAALETQFKNDFFTRGFKTWNVQLAKSLNSMPPKGHRSGLPGKSESAPISSLRQLTSSDFVLSSSSENASINVWSTRAGLTQISSLNFKLQAHIDPKQSLTRARLLHLNYGPLDHDSGAKLYLRNRPRPEEAIPAASTDPAAEPLANDDSKDGKGAEHSKPSKESGAEPKKLLPFRSKKTSKRRVRLLKNKQAAGQSEGGGEADILQAMYDEAAAIGEVSGEEDSSDGEEFDDFWAEFEKVEDGVNDPDYVEDVYEAHDLGDQLAKGKLSLTKEASTTHKKKEDKAKKEVPEKKASKAEETAETPAEPNAEACKTLQEMGFSEEVSRAALIKVKNDISAAYDAAVALQAEQLAANQKAEASKVAKKEWPCPTCTVINQPGGSKCQLCGAAVPADACVDEEEERAKKEAEDRAKKEEEERIEREKKLEEELRLQNELKQKQEEEHRQAVKAEFEATKEFLAESKVDGFVFSSIKGGGDVTPLLTGAVMTNKEKGVADLHLKSLSYRRAYLENFVRTSLRTGQVENRLTRELFDCETDCIESVLANHQELLEALYPALGGHHDQTLKSNHILQSSDIGVARLPLKEVTNVCQVGDDLTPSKPLVIFIQGHKLDGKQACFSISVSLKDSLDDPFAVSISEHSEGPLSTATSLHYCTSSHTLILSQASTYDLYHLPPSSTSSALPLPSEPTSAIPRSDSSAVFKVEQGQLFVQDDQQVTSYGLSQGDAKDGDKKELDPEGEQSKEEGVDVYKPPDAPIDPEKVTQRHLELYEELMKGQAVPAISNA